MLIFYFVFIQVDKYIRYYNLFIFNTIKLYLKKNHEHEHEVFVRLFLFLKFIQAGLNCLVDQFWPLSHMFDTPALQG